MSFRSIVLINILFLIGCSKNVDDYKNFNVNFDKFSKIKNNTNQDNFIMGGGGSDTFQFTGSEVPVKTITGFTKSSIQDFTNDDKLDISAYYDNWKTLKRNMIQYDNDTIIFLTDRNIIIIKNQKIDDLKNHIILSLNNVQTIGK